MFPGHTTGMICRLHACEPVANSAMQLGFPGCVGEFSRRWRENFSFFIILLHTVNGKLIERTDLDV